MPRKTYCREQAALCRDLAKQIGNRADAQHLQDMAVSYEAEARSLEAQQGQSRQEPKPDLD
jgi:hypothetical protein